MKDWRTFPKAEYRIQHHKINIFCQTNCQFRFSSDLGQNKTVTQHFCCYCVASCTEIKLGILLNYKLVLIQSDLKYCLLMISKYLDWFITYSIWGMFFRNSFLNYCLLLSVVIKRSNQKSMYPTHVRLPWFWDIWENVRTFFP